MNENMKIFNELKIIQTTISLNDNQFLVPETTSTSNGTTDFYHGYHGK